MTDLKRVGNPDNLDCRAPKYMKLDPLKQDEKVTKLDEQSYMLSKSKDVEMKEQHTREDIKETNPYLKDNIKPDAVVVLCAVCSSPPQHPATTSRQRVNVATNTDFTTANIERFKEYVNF